MEKPGSTLKRSDAFGSDESEGRPPPQPGLLLVFSSGRPMFHPIALTQDEIDLGRENLGIKLEDGKISRSHVRVGVKDGAFSATDLGSLNGTVVDGQQLPARDTRALTRCLRLGDTLLLPVADLNPLRSGNLIVQEGLVIGPRRFELYQRIGRAAASSATLHITGESGSGKENAARAYHDVSPNRGPFIAVNCDDSGGHRRAAVVRRQARRIFGRGRGQRRLHPGRKRRHAVPGRGRRIARHGASEAPARARDPGGAGGRCRAPAAGPRSSNRTATWPKPRAVCPYSATSSAARSPTTTSTSAV